MLTLIFLRGLCRIVWLNILTLLTPGGSPGRGEEESRGRVGFRKSLYGRKQWVKGIQCRKRGYRDARV